MSLDASFDSLDSFQIPERPYGTRRATARERRLAAELDADREGASLFHMAIDRPAPEDVLFYVLLGASGVIAALGVAWAVLPVMLQLG